MKFKNIIAWSLLGLFIEFFGFLYVDKVYLAESNNFKFKQVDINKKKNLVKLNIDIPKNADMLCVSYDGKYAAYSVNGQLTVVDRVKNSSKSVKLYEDTTCSFLKWLPDRNILYIAERRTSSSVASIRLASYNAEKNDNVQWEYDGKIVKIILPSKGYEVKDMAISTQTSVTYICAESAYRSIIYRYNIMSQSDKAPIKFSYKVGKIGVMQLEDQLAYENPVYRKLVIQGHSNFLNGKGINNPCFLGGDYDGNAYIGKRSGQEVTKVYYGTFDESFSKWNSIDVTGNMSENDIFVSVGGNIYGNDTVKNEIINLKSGKNTKYSGKFISVNKEAVVYLDGSKLTEKPLN